MKDFVERFQSLRHPSLNFWHLTTEVINYPRIYPPKKKVRIYKRLVTLLNTQRHRSVQNQLEGPCLLRRWELSRHCWILLSPASQVWSTKRHCSLASRTARAAFRATEFCCRRPWESLKQKSKASGRHKKGVLRDILLRYCSSSWTLRGFRFSVDLLIYSVDLGYLSIYLSIYRSIYLSVQSQFTPLCLSVHLFVIYG